MTGVTPTTTDHWKAFIGRTALLLLGGFLIAMLLFGFSRTAVASLLIGFFIGFPQHLRTHHFFVSRLSVNEEEGKLVVHGQRFNWGFEPEEQTFDLDGLHQIELIPRQWWENADELRLTGRAGMSETLKVVPKFLTQVEVNALNDRLGATTTAQAATT